MDYNIDEKKNSANQNPKQLMTSIRNPDKSSSCNAEAVCKFEPDKTIPPYILKLFYFGLYSSSGTSNRHILVPDVVSCFGHCRFVGVEKESEQKRGQSESDNVYVQE